MSKDMVNNHKTMESLDMPEVVGPYNDDQWKVDYGASRGSRMFDNKPDAEADLVNFIDMRVNSLSRQMFELLRLKRRMEK